MQEQTYWLMSFTLLILDPRKGDQELSYTVLENRHPALVLKDVMIQQRELAKKYDHNVVLKDVFYEQVSKEIYDECIDEIGSYYAR